MSRPVATMRGKPLLLLGSRPRTTSCGGELVKERERCWALYAGELSCYMQLHASFTFGRNRIRELTGEFVDVRNKRILERVEFRITSRSERTYVG